MTTRPRFADEMNDRWNRGLWETSTKIFEAKYPTQCAHCKRGIGTGEDMAGVFTKTQHKKWMHAACLSATGTPEFVGKPQARR